MPICYVCYFIKTCDVDVNFAATFNLSFFYFWLKQLDERADFILQNCKITKDKEAA